MRLFHGSQPSLQALVGAICAAAMSNFYEISTDLKMDWVLDSILSKSKIFESLQAEPPLGRPLGPTCPNDSLKGGDKNYFQFCCWKNHAPGVVDWRSDVWFEPRSEISRSPLLGQTAPVQAFSTIATFEIWVKKGVKELQCTMHTLKSRNSSGLLALGYIFKNHQKYLIERHFFLKLKTWRKIEKI